jgi:hypothetical protein
MVLRTAAELRESAKRMREMATQGGDSRLAEALVMVASEFEQEADRMADQDRCDETAKDT